MCDGAGHSGTWDRGAGVLARILAGKLFVGLGQSVGVVAGLNGAPAAGDKLDQARDGCEEFELQLGQVFAGAEIAAVRTGADKDHWVVAHLLDLGVIPAPPQVIADVVVRSKGHPLRLQVIAGVLCEVDTDHLPVTLVVVGAIKT